MIKKIFILLISITISLNASMYEKIENIIGTEAFNTHKNLIDHIFYDQSQFYLEEGVNYPLLTQKLYESNLLELDLGSAQFVDITFVISDNPKKSLYILKEILKSLGHYYYFTSETIFYNQFKWSIRLKTEAAINPLALSRALALRDCIVTDIRKEGDFKWYYSINSSNAKMYNVSDLVQNNELFLRSSSTTPYMLEIAHTKRISLYPGYGNRWRPLIVFYDEHLNAIRIVKRDRLHRYLRLYVPKKTKYIKIDDVHSLSNIKRGIRITKE